MALSHLQIKSCSITWLCYQEKKWCSWENNKMWLPVWILGHSFIKTLGFDLFLVVVVLTCSGLRLIYTSLCKWIALSYLQCHIGHNIVKQKLTYTDCEMILITIDSTCFSLWVVPCSTFLCLLVKHMTDRGAYSLSKLWHAIFPFSWIR